MAIDLEAWRAWYGLRRWRKRAKFQLQHEPWCKFCAERGIARAAAAADHIEPHHGDPTKFWFGALQSLCARCHNSTKAYAEHRGYSSEISADGYPLDPKHPANAH